MKKILLTSCGIIDENLQKEFKKLFSKNVEDLKVLYIPIAADVEKGDKTWLKKEYNSILLLGIKEENILEYRMDYEIDINKFDFIYVMGGNTFYLLQKIRENKFEDKIISAIENGIVYVGSSAGSITMGTTIETSCDVNDNYVTDFTGLKMFDGIIIPHANKREEYIKEQRKKYTDIIYPINDKHGILIVDDKMFDI